MSMRDTIQAFLDSKKVAIVGASPNRDNFGRSLMEELKKKDYEVIPVNPKYEEVEGIACLGLFDQFVNVAKSHGISFVPLGTFLTDHSSIRRSTIVRQQIRGRDGWLSCQAPVGVEVDQLREAHVDRPN